MHNDTKPNESCYMFPYGTVELDKKLKIKPSLVYH